VHKIKAPIDPIPHRPEVEDIPREEAEVEAVGGEEEELEEEEHLPRTLQGRTEMTVLLPQ
jgi:hypothetical protein